MTAPARRLRPNLPPHFYAPNPALVAVWFLYGTASFFGGGYLAHALWLSDGPPLLIAPAMLLLIVIASNGLHLLGWLAHEGIHLSMVRSRHLNLLLGSFVGSVLMLPAIGLGIAHWPHHRFTNGVADPDTVVQARHQTFWRRFLLARIHANRTYLGNALRLMFGRPLPDSYRMPFSHRALALHAWLGTIFMLGWLLAYGLVAWYDMSYFLIAILGPFLAMIPITGLRVYIEHAGTLEGEAVDARSYTSPLYTLLLFGNNYHLEHHLYPKVPGYRLPLLHRMLKAEGFYDRFADVPIVPGVLPPLRFTTGRFHYPSFPARHAESAKLSAHSTLDPVQP